MTDHPPDLSALLGRTFDGVLFDLDGTLIDSTPAVVRSWLAWAVEYGVDPLALEGNHGVPAGQIVASVLPEPEVAAALARIIEIELADVEGIRGLPGAADALLAAGTAGAIVTSCTRALALARLGATGLPVPAVLVTADDVRHGKPDPAPYLLGARLLGVDPATCLVVEDAPMGLIAGCRAGATTLAVTTTTPVAELVADAVVGDLGDVVLVRGPGGVTVTRPDRPGNPA